MQFQVHPDGLVIVRGLGVQYTDTHANFASDFVMAAPDEVPGVVSLFYDDQTGALWGSTGNTQVAIPQSFAHTGDAAFPKLATALEKQAARYEAERKEAERKAALEAANG